MNYNSIFNIFKNNRYNPTAPRRGSEGFTIIELLTIVGIISIITVLAMPSILSWMPRYHLKTATMDLFLNLNKAKTEAAKRNRYCTITFNLPGYDYRVYIDANQNLELDAGEEIIGSVRFDDYKSGVCLEGLTFTNNDNGRPSVAFDPMGLPRNNGGSVATGSVLIKNKRDDKRLVDVNTTGMIKISSL